jgi:membrane-associated phospholipid phosphatase
MADRRTVAEVISAVFNAPFVSLYAFVALILYLSTQDAPTLLFIAAIFGTVLPTGVILYMRKRGIIRDVYASERGTRFKPFLAALVSYLIGMLMLLALGAPRSVTALMACYLVNTGVMTIITLKWKISIHASGVAGPATFFVFTLGPALLPLLLVILPVGWARITLGAHTRNQVLAGFFLTIALTWFQLAIYMI